MIKKQQLDGPMGLIKYFYIIYDNKKYRYMIIKQKYDNKKKKRMEEMKAMEAKAKAEKFSDKC